MSRSGGCACAAPPGHHWADVVVAVPPGAALAQAHAVADRVEEALDRVLPGIDAVVHVEPGAGSLVERVRAAAQGVERVREVHNVQLIDVDGRTEASLHLKLPAETPLADADATARQVQAAVRDRGARDHRRQDPPRTADGPAGRPSRR